MSKRFVRPEYVVHSSAEPTWWHVVLAVAFAVAFAWGMFELAAAVRRDRPVPCVCQPT